MAFFADKVARTRQGILLAAGFFILVMIGGVAAWLVNQAAADAEQVARTLTTQDQFSNVLLNLRRAESGQRGYLFTNQKNYLDDYKTTQPEANDVLRQLYLAAYGNPADQARIQTLDRLVAARFKEMDQTIELNASGQREQARAIVMSGSGRDSMNEIRKLVEQAITDESRLLSSRAERSQRNNFILLVLTLAGSGLIVLIGTLSVYLVQRNARAREKAQQELAGINANLERIVQFRTADLQEANEEIQRFAYIVSHDLRSPLVNIMGFTTELESLRTDIFDELAKLRTQLTALNARSESAATGEPAEKLGQEFDEAVGFIKTSIAKMDRLISAVLKLSREGRREFRPENIAMNALMESIARNVAHRAAEQGARVTIGDLPDIESDRLAMEQIFSNLLDNALKYLRDETPGRIEIVGRSNAAQSIYEVRDNGRGIDPNDHQRVFELFRRSGPQDRPGEGIGLAHVRALVRRVGGQMTLASELGKGTVFTVILPRGWAAESRSVA